MATTKILIADDDEEIRRALTAALSGNGYHSTSVSDGDEAIAYLRDNPVDVLILDIMMPRVSGLEVLRHVQKQLPALKIIVLSGYLGTNLQRECENLGALHTLTKPYDFEDLMAILSAL